MARERAERLPRLVAPHLGGVVVGGGHQEVAGVWLEAKARNEVHVRRNRVQTFAVPQIPNFARIVCTSSRQLESKRSWESLHL